MALRLVDDEFARMLDQLVDAMGRVDDARGNLFAAWWESDPVAASAHHKNRCDALPGDPPYPGMLPMPCPICDSDGWDAWTRDPYGYADASCKRCGGKIIDRDARRKVTEHCYIGHCYACGGPTRNDRALDMAECVAESKRGRARPIR